MQPIRVLLADDHAVVRQGLQSVLALEADMDVVGEAATGDEAIEETCRLSPDVLLLDLRMPDTDGLDVCRELAGRGVDTRVLVLSSFLDGHVLEALDACVAGYMLKSATPEALVQAIRGVAQGTSVFDGSVVGLLTEHGAPGAETCLSQREREVLTLIAEGLSNKEIARRLWLGLATVKTHVGSILRKLGCQDRTQAALLAVRGELVDVEDSSQMEFSVDPH